MTQGLAQIALTMSEEDLDFLQGLQCSARAPWPDHWQAWYLSGHAGPLGLLSPNRAELLARSLPADAPLRRHDQGWGWHADKMTLQERSAILQTISHDLSLSGALTGWRDETHACWGNIEADWPYSSPVLLSLERAAFRFWGLRSHAAHVHGMTTDGRMWCGRRANNKATDPGMLDNLAAGGLPVDEDPVACAVRELQEEAGLRRHALQLRPCPTLLVTERQETQGWHSERLFVYSTLVADHETPVNQDGEVSEFLCLEIAEVLQRMREGEFTADAACAIAVFLLSQERR